MPEHLCRLRQVVKTNMGDSHISSSATERSFEKMSCTNEIKCEMLIYG